MGESIIFRSLLSPDKKRLIENFLSLSVLQAVNYLLPLITFPYLVRVLGPEKFGLISFAQAFIQYFIIITDYGFNLTATREISIHRDDHQKLSKIFSSVLIIKQALLVASFLVLFTVILLFNKFSREWILYLLTFGIVLGHAIFPLWFFQGLEKMKYIMTINVLAKVLFTASIFIFIHKPAHYIYVPLLNSGGLIFAGLLSLYLIWKKFKIRLIFPPLSDLKRQMTQGWNIFLSSVSTNFYKTNDIFILGIFGSEVIVGYYVIAKKLIDASNQFAVIVSQVIFPYISNTIHSFYRKVIHFLQNIFYILSAVTVFIGVVFLFFSEQIVDLVAGEAYPLSILVLKILAFVPLIIGINVPAAQILLGSGKDKLYSRVLISGGVVNTVLNFSLIPLFSYIGACFAVIGSEIFVTSVLYISLKMNIADIRR